MPTLHDFRLPHIAIFYKNSSFQFYCEYFKFSLPFLNPYLFQRFRN